MGKPLPARQLSREREVSLIIFKQLFSLCWLSRQCAIVNGFHLVPRFVLNTLSAFFIYE